MEFTKRVPRAGFVVFLICVVSGSHIRYDRRFGCPVAQTGFNMFRDGEQKDRHRRTGFSLSCS